jgi:hypothetical protein
VKPTQITWHDAKTLPPPLFQDVLLAVPGERESSEGYRYSKGLYYFTDGHEAEGVYAWASLPLRPPIAPTLKPLRKSKIVNRKSKISGGSRA